jgi:hypothetical protein
VLRRSFRPVVNDVLEPRLVPSSYLVSGMYSGDAGVTGVTASLQGTASGGDLSGSSKPSFTGLLTTDPGLEMTGGHLSIYGLNRVGVRETLTFNVQGTYGPLPGGSWEVIGDFTEVKVVGDETTMTTGTVDLDLNPSNGSFTGQLIDLL